MNDWKKGNQEKKIEKIRELSIQLFDKKEKDLEEQKIEQGVIDFKTFILEQYYIKYKDRKDELKILFNLINKFLKTEVEEIGIRIYKYFYSIVNIHYDKIGEINIRAYTEFLIYINENSPRIIDIWHNNINSKKNEKKLIKNSIDLLGYFSYNVLYSYQNYNKYLNENKNIQQYDYLLELKTQNDAILEKITKAIYSIKIIEKEDISDNLKNFILEKYLFFLIQVIYFFFLIKKKNITNEEAEFICHCFQFVLKNTAISYIYQMTLKYLEGVLSLGQVNENGDINEYNKEFIKNWKLYLNENNYLQNKYKSDSKYNCILKFILKYYLYCFNRQGNNIETIPFFKDLYKNIISDNLRMFKNLTSKINDFRISLELKGQIIILIYQLYDFSNKESREPKFEDLYFFLKQLTSFYQTLFTLTNEYIGSPIKEEKQQQKEIFQKNMLKINIEEQDYNSIQKINLNHHFLILLSNEYDKYIYIEDPKLLYEFMKNSLSLVKNFIEIFKTILDNKENMNNFENQNYLINRIAVQLSKFFYYFYYVFERNRMNHQNHEIQQDLIDRLLEMYLGFSHELLIAVFKRLMPYILKLYKFGNKISPIKNSISNKLIHNIFKTIKDTKIREILFEIYFEFFSMKIYETGNPNELFNSEPNNPSNASLSLNESINNITIKIYFF